jgi:hypothetical protein
VLVCRCVCDAYQRDSKGRHKPLCRFCSQQRGTANFLVRSARNNHIWLNPDSFEVCTVTPARLEALKTTASLAGRPYFAYRKEEEELQGLSVVPARYLRSVFLCVVSVWLSLARSLAFFHAAPHGSPARGSLSGKRFLKSMQWMAFSQLQEDEQLRDEDDFGSGGEWVRFSRAP